VKTGKDDTSVLLAGGGDALISSFGGIEDITSTVSSYGANMVFINATFIKIG
jgi:N-acetylmuramic acid 6-phosphate (MurNAc-6-P) etherase